MIQRYLTVGVDAGEVTGLAVYDARQNKITATHSTDFFGCFKFIRDFDKEAVNMVVEVPPVFIYARNASQKGAVRDKHAILIGGTRRESQLLARGLRILGYRVKEVLPVRAKKWTAEQFKRELGFEGKSNQHVRDAARLAFYHSSMRF